MLRNDITVNVNIGFDPLPFGVIGSTAAEFVERDYADVRNKYFSVDGGTTALTQFATGMTHGTGSQASHWREFLFAGYLMDPQLFPGSQRAITPTDLRAFDVMGYNIPEPTSAALLLAGLGVWPASRRLTSASRPRQ